jgi:WD40 repeat protein
MDTRQVVARFEAERQALAMMDHPNIAKVLDAGATEGGRPFFIMELVRGIRITDYCDQNKLSTQQRLDLFVLVCNAVQHAHQKGIIHRDIKPSNILVTLHDGVPVPKVIDFGIAKATEGRLTDLTVYTELHQFIGTPAYMSPEQAEMSGLDIDTRSDIYSLGVLLYELLTGRTPFDARDLLAASLDEMRRTIREKEPVRPSTRLSTLVEGDLTTVAQARASDPPRLVSLIRGDLDWIVMKALEKDRTRRYETANGLAADLKRHLNNEPVVARPPSATYRLRKALRRNKLAFAAMASVALALVVGLAAATWQFLRERQTRKRAEMAEQAQIRLRETAQRAQASETQLRQLGDAQKLDARLRAYASDMNLAQQALAANNLGRAQELLDRNRAQLGERDLRGWEWRYLWQFCRTDALFTLCQISNEVFSLAASHDGKWIAVGGFKYGQLSLWDLRARQEIVPLSAGERSVRVAFSPRDSLLAFSWVSGAAHNRRQGIRIWNGITRSIVAEIPVGGDCYGLGFSEDGRTLVVSTGEPDNQITLWQIPEGRKLASHPAPQIDYGVGTPFTVDRGLSVAAHSLPNRGFRVIDLSTGLERWRSQIDDDRVYTLALSADGKILASSAGLLASLGSPIRLWEVTSGREIAVFEGHSAWIGELVFWPDGKTLASTSADQTIRLWDLTNLPHVRPLHSLLGHRLEVPRLVLLPDNTTLVSGCKDGSVKVWDSTTSRRDLTRITLPAVISNWRFSLDSQSVLSVDRQGRVARWQGKEFREMEVLVDIGTNHLGPCMSDDGRWLAAGSTNGLIRVWDLENRTQQSALALHDGAVLPWTFLSQGRKLVIIHPDDGSVHEWDLTTRQESQASHSSVEAGYIFAYRTPGSFSPDERWRLTIGYQNASVLRDMAAKHERVLDFDKRGAVNAAFSPDSKLLAVASDYGFARLWETATLRDVATLRGFLLGVHSVTFSPDGKRVATGSAGKEAVKLWDVESRQEVLTLEGQKASSRSSAFSPDGNVLGSLNELGVLHLWRAPSWQEITAAEALNGIDRSMKISRVEAL